VDDRDRTSDPTEGVRIIGEDEAAQAIRSGPTTSSSRPKPPEGTRPALRFPQPEHSLAHGGDATAAQPPMMSSDEPDDDLDAWSSFATGSPRWRDQQTDWEQADFDTTAMADDPAALGGVAPHRPLPDPLDDPEPAAIDEFLAYAPDDDDEMGRNVVVALLVAVAFGAVALFAFSQGAAATVVLAAGVLGMAAAEFFKTVQTAGYQPATLVGLVGVPAMVLAAYWQGELSYPVTLGLGVVTSFLWFLTGVSRARPTENAAITIFGLLYVGFLGSFAALLLRWPGGHGTGLLLGAVLATVAYDTGGFFVGRRMGRSPLAPEISPNKTYEGLLGGLIASAAVCLAVVSQVGPWDLGAALALAVVASVAAPLGDLAESMIKRDLGIKDTSSILPGHGGFLDRFDSLLFVLPATYFVARVLDLGLS